MRNEIINAIEDNKLIAIVRGVKKEQLIPLAEALYRGGIRLLEVTYSADGRVSDEETAKCIDMLAEHFQGRMFVGAGTVLTEEQVERTKSAGGCFIISPDTNAEVIQKTRALEMVSIPGALTPTEIRQAQLAGADFVKLFPVTSLGASYVRAVRAPLSNVRLLAVGGIDENNMEEYLAAGACGFGISSGMVNLKLLDACDYEGITALAKKYTAVIEK